MPRRCTQCPVMIQIMDVNDNPPVINPPTTFSIPETSPTGTHIGCINADDADSGQNALLNYSLAAGTEECSIPTPFLVNETSGCIEVCQPLDFESVVTYSFNVTVTDMGSNQLSTGVTITVDIINENDHPPVITSATIADVLEEVPNALVLTVTASDEDAPPFNNVTFSLDDNAGGRFTIDPTSGVVLTTQSLDRETQPSFTIIVRADDGAFSDTQNITVFLTDINDNPPVYIGPDTINFPEESLFEYVVIFTDRDVGVNARLVYNVSDSRFNISNHGVVRNLVPLDREQETEISLEIVALDMGEPSRRETVVINLVLIDINDNAPQAVEPFMADVIDGSPTGTVVITVTATDADEGMNAALEFSLTDDGDGTFAINNETGVVTLIRDINLISSSVVTISFTVSIMDRGIPSQAITQNYTIFVVSSVPGFLEDQYTFSISENSLGEPVGMIMAMDRDLNALNDAFEYTILSVNPYDAGYTVISSNGTATLISPPGYLDFEDSSIFNITLGVSRPNMSVVIDDTAIVVITILGSNDNTPRLSPLNITAQLLEHSPKGTIVATATAIDFDLGPSGQLTFNHSGNGQEYFEFDSIGNFIVSNSTFVDFESDMSFTFTYQACDNGVPRVCSEPGFIFITIVNIDDLPPIFDPSSYTEEISELFGFNRIITFVNFSDPDTPSEDITLTLEPPQSQFTILLLNGQGALMTTDQPLDRETTPIHTFNVVATDTATGRVTATVTIILLDENDERPSIQPTDNVVFFEEGIGTARPAVGLGIVDRDDISQFPLRSVSVSLRPSPSSFENFPLPGGQCNHDNYTILYDNNVHSLCSLGGCRYLLDPTEVTGGQIAEGILDLDESQFARNGRAAFNGDQLLDFSMTIWVRFSASSSGFIVEMQSSENIFSLGVESDGSLSIQVNPAGNNAITLVATGELPTHNGEWHQIAVVRQESTMSIYFDSEIVASANNINSSIDSPFTRGVFQQGTFFLGNRLQNAFFSEFYFCDSVITDDNLLCSLTCGETLDVTSDTENVTVSVNHRTQSVELTYIGSDPLASLTQLEAAMGNVLYRNILDEPHPLDRGVFFLVTDMIGPSDREAVVILRPILINDQRPVLDLNGLATSGIDFATAFDETSLGTEIIGMNAVLYDRDSGYWPLDRITIRLVNPGPLESLVNRGTSDVISVIVSTESVVLQPINVSMPAFPGSYLDALRNIQYLDVEEEPVEFDRTIDFTVLDEGSLHVNDPLSFTTVTVTPTNDRPTLDLDITNSNSRDAMVTYVEQMERVNILSPSLVEIADEDSQEFSRAVFTFVTRPDGEAESLTVPSSVHPIDSNFDNINGVLMVSGMEGAEFDATEWAQIFGDVVYMNTDGGLSDVAIREVSVVITDVQGADSEPAFVRITVSPFNNPPTINLGGPGRQNYFSTFIEDGSCIRIAAPDAEIFDPDTGALQNMRIDLNSPFTSRGERLQLLVPTTPQIASFPFAGDSSILFFPDNTNSIEAFERALRNVVYCNDIDEPDESFNRTVTVFAVDSTLTTEGGLSRSGSTSSNSIFTTQIIRVNDRPELFFEPQQNVSIRGVPTIIINPDSIDVEDSDDTIFSQLIISITNPQDGPENEIIQFDMDLPSETVSIGPLQGANNSIEYSVTFQNNGGIEDRVVLTIGRIRFNNIANDITVDPPREICVQISDFKIFSEKTCVIVSISPANNFNPVFDNTADLEFMRFESDSSLTLTILRATDADSGLEGEISFRIAQVLSTILVSPPVTRLTTSLFDIDPETGLLTAPNGLDADVYQLHNITVIAEDMGNPVLTDTVYVIVEVEDLNDESPVFLNISGDSPPYNAPSQREELDPPRPVFIVAAQDPDFTSPNNIIDRYELLNYQDRFSINNQGLIQFIQLLDAEEQDVYDLNIAAIDRGVPPQTSYTTVFFSVTDFNDNAAQIQQLAPSVFVIGGGATSIGSALRIVDPDLGLAAISSIEITLTPNAVDNNRQYIDCLVVCQEERLEDAELLSTAIDLLNAATFQSDNNVVEAFNDTDTIGAGNCPAVTVNRIGNNDNRADDGYGRIPRANLPADFGSGEFSFSFVLRQEAEGFVVIIPDMTDETLGPVSVDREFSVYIRRRDIALNYVYGAGNVDRTAYSPPNRDAFTPGVTRHYTIVVRLTSSTTAEVDFYFDCGLVATNILLGVPLIPSPNNADVFIGNSRPPALNGGRLGGTLHGLYYHNRALTAEQVLDFCSCGQELLVVPSLPSTVQLDTLTNERVVLVANGTDLIPQGDAEHVLRSIGYLNTFIDPTINPPRILEFSVTEETGVSDETVGNVYLVQSDNALPVLNIDLTSAELSYALTFTEDGGPITIAPNSGLTRDIEGFLSPSFERVMVELTNGQDMDETLSAISGVPYITVQQSANRHMIEIIGPGIAADFIAVLDTLVYENSDDRPTTSSPRIIEFTVTDPQGRVSNPLAVTTVNLMAVNDPPVVSLSSNSADLFSAVEYDESTPGVFIIPDVVVQDVDSDNLVGATLTLTTPTVGMDTLTVNESNPAISVSFSGNVLSLSGSASLEEYREVLTSVNFFSTDSPFLDNSGQPEEDPTRTVLIEVYDGELSSDAAQVTIEFIPRDDPPQVTFSNTTIIFRDGDETVLIAPDATITDSDNRILASMSVQLVDFSGDDVLRSGSNVGPTLIFETPDAIASFESILRGIEYVNLAAEPGLAPRPITVTVNDFMGSSVTMLTIVLEDVNDIPPTFDSSAYNFNVFEDVIVGTAIGNMTVFDADSGNNIITLSLSSTDVPFTLNRIEGVRVWELTTSDTLDLEDTPSYSFNVTANDGVNINVAQVTVSVLNVNEPPIITLDPPTPNVVLGPSSVTQLLDNTPSIVDLDAGDGVSVAILALRDVPSGSNESLSWTNNIVGYEFQEISPQIYQLESVTSNVSLEDALRSVTYVVGSIVTSLTVIRTVGIVVVDSNGLSSDEVTVGVSLASVPEFSQKMYNVSLLEGMLSMDFLQVQATVESGGDIIEYAVEQGFDVFINSSTGYLSLFTLLDRETMPTVSFEVYAIDALPPARTGTAVVNINVIDANDVVPMIDGLNNLTVSTNVPVSLFPDVTVTDPDTVALILRATVSLSGDPLPSGSLTERVCVDEYNTITKMTSVCGLSGFSFIDLVNQVSATGPGSIVETRQPGSNAVLTSSGDYATITANFADFTGQIDAFTLAFWIQTNSSGYIVYYGNTDLTERYLTVYYSINTNQLTLTLKRQGLSGLRAQIRISFQLPADIDLSDGSYHFIMIQYGSRDVVCVVDAQRVNSVAVVYKESPFLGTVFGKSCMHELIIVLHEF